MRRKPPSASQGSSTEKPGAYAKALGLLVRREHSQRELQTRLERDGYSAEESSAAMETLQSGGQLSNARFAEMLARTRSSNGYGPLRITAELRTHAITDAEIRAVLDALEVDWHDLAQRQLRRHFGQRGAVDAKARARQAAFLLRRGFDAATVSALTRSKT
jgi:regulatory protein